jgi:hypothetical protein
MLFNDHILTAENALVDAVNQLNTFGIDDLVVDVRYNGGGFLFIASQLAYMIGGPAQIAGRPFETLEFNDQHPITDPVTGQPIEPMPFYAVTLDGASLPVLDLPIPRLRTHRPRHLFGQRVDYERSARCGRRSYSDRLHDLRQALRFLSHR